MAENPASWTPVHHAIQEAIREWERAISHQIIGYSMIAHIYNKLKEKKLLNEI